MATNPATHPEGKRIPHLIAGEWRQSSCDSWIDVTDPATQEVLCQAPNTTPDEMEQAIASAKAAFKTWKDVPTPERARMMLRYQALLKEHHDELGEILAKETGKTFADAKGDVWRGIEVVEQACNISTSMMGEAAEQIANGIDTRTIMVCRSSWSAGAIPASSMRTGISIPMWRHCSKRWTRCATSPTRAT